MKITPQDFSDRSRKTAVEKLQGSLDQQASPLRQIQDTLRRHSPGDQMQKLLKQLEPSRHIRELMDSSSISRQVDMLRTSTITSQAHKLMRHTFPKNAFGVSHEFLRHVAGLDAISMAAKQHERLLKPIAQQQEFLERLRRQALGGLFVQDFAKQIQQATPALAAMEAARKSIDDIWGQFGDIDFSRLDAGEQDEGEAGRAAQTITQGASDKQSFQEAIELIVASIQGQKNPTVQLMLWLTFRKIMDWLIAGTIGAVLGHYISAALGESPQAAKKSAHQTARAVGSSELLAEYRYVSAQILFVRQNPRARSPEIGRLVFGKVVKLIKKDKDFALVLWTDPESGAEIQGWVFSRYLEKFN